MVGMNSYTLCISGGMKCRQYDCLVVNALYVDKIVSRMELTDIKYSLSMRIFGWYVSILDNANKLNTESFLVTWRDALNGRDVGLQVW